jgi:hypothetical protein
MMISIIIRIRILIPTVPKVILTMATMPMILGSMVIVNIPSISSGQRHKGVSFHSSCIQLRKNFRKSYKGVDCTSL